MSQQVIAVAALLLWSLAAAAGGAYRATAHGDAVRGVLRLPGERRGACRNCHTSSGRTERPRGAGGAGMGLFAPNDNDLCFSCHRSGDPQRGFPTAAVYARGAHGTSAAMVWPGPTPPPRSGVDAGRCVNCHDPHGAADGAGIVPSLLTVRGDGLCLRCHDGSRAPSDVAADLAKPYRHAGPAQPGGAGASGFGGCGDCHDPHRARSSREVVLAPASPAPLAGARRVRVTNGAAGTAPLLEEIERDGGPFAAEYEVCLRCHAAGGVPGRADIGMLVNPANASFHPVEAAGRNAGVDPGSFVRGWRWDRLVRCSDCHGSDDPSRTGTHGSRYQGLLRKPYSAALRGATIGDGDLCFQCHAYATYARPGIANVASRYTGHSSHSARGIGCGACHDAHGSPGAPGLLAFRPGGLLAYAQAAAGGTCTASCHVTAPAVSTYSVSYPR